MNNIGFNAPPVNFGHGSPRQATTSISEQNSIMELLKDNGISINEFERLISNRTIAIAKILKDYYGEAFQESSEEIAKIFKNLLQKK